MKNIDRIIIAITIPSFLALLFLISFFTAPISDESLPFAISLRFLQGQRPFIDDLSPYIGLGLLLAPIVKLSLLLHGGKNELILFLRHSYVVFSVLCGIYAFLATKKYLPTLIAIFIALCVATFHPFGINNFHYDTLGLTLWTIIIFQLYNFQFNLENTTTDYAIFSVLNVFLCLAYPPFLLLLIPLYCGIFFVLKEKKKFYLSHFVSLSTAALFMTWLIFSYFDVHLSDIKNTLAFNLQLSQFSAHGLSKIQKLFNIITHLFTLYMPLLTLSSSLIVAAYYFKKHKLITSSFLLSALIAPLFFTHFAKANYANVFYYFNTIGFSGAIVYLFFLRQDLLAKRLFYSIWVTSFFAGLLTSFSSYNLELNFIIGFFPAVILGFIYYYLALKELDKDNHYLSRGLILFGLALFFYCQSYYIYGGNQRGIHIYTDQNKYQMAGPFKGLYIDPDWTKTLKSLQKEIAAIDTNDNTFVYFGVFSSGYLLVDKLKTGDYLAYCYYDVDHYGQKVRTPNYTIDLSRTLDIPKESIRIYLSRNKYTKLSANPSFDIYYSD